MRSGLILLFVLTLAPIQAQGGDIQKSLSRAKGLYALGDSKGVVDELLPVMGSWERLTQEERRETGVYLGLAYSRLGERERAISAFLRALETDPSIDLPSGSPPQAVEALKAARSRSKMQPESPPLTLKKEPVVQTVPAIEKTPKGALYRSLAFPGLGQAYNGEKTKAYILSCSEGASLISIAVFSVLAVQARHSYMDAQGQGTIDSRYRSYELYTDLRNAFIPIAAGIWAYGAIDAYLMGRKHVEPKALPPAIPKKMSFNRDGAVVSWEINF